MLDSFSISSHESVLVYTYWMTLGQNINALKLET